MDAFGNIFNKPAEEEKQDKVRLLFKNVPNMKNQNDVSSSVLSNNTKTTMRKVRFNFGADVAS